MNGGYTFVTRERDLDFWVAAGSVEYRVTKEWSLVTASTGHHRPQGRQHLGRHRRLLELAGPPAG